MLFNFNTPNAGSASVNGKSILGLPQQKIRELGVALVPEDRMLYGIASGASIEENVISDRSGEKRFNKGPLFNMKAIHAEADRLIKEYTVLCKSRSQQVGMLSGVVPRFMTDCWQAVIDGTPYTVKKTMNADPRRIGQIDIVFNFPEKEYTEKQKALLWAAAESCPVGRSLHPDVIVNITMNFQG